MNQSNLYIMLQNRKACKKILDNLSVDQINKIPPGFNNNVFWNVGHIIAVQQRLIYGLSSQIYSVDDVFVQTFLPGTKPESYYDDAKIVEVKHLLALSYDQMITDIRENKFEKFIPFITALRFEINDLDSSIAFNQYHEALHMGHILNLLRFI